MKELLENDKIYLSNLKGGINLDTLLKIVQHVL